MADVLCTGRYGAVKAGIGPGTSVTVIGDGAVGLSAVLVARRLGAGQIVLMGSYKDRTDLGREFGATGVILETVGHKSTHVTETVYRHVIAPAIRGGASVMDDLFGDDPTGIDQA